MEPLYRQMSIYKSALFLFQLGLSEVLEGVIMSVEYRNITKQYGDGEKAVDEFSLVVPSHSTTVLVGSSGCGKTTLLRMVNRMVDPDQGQLLIDDQDVTELEPVRLRRSIGYVMQNAGLMPHQTVIENIQTVARLQGKAKSELEQPSKEMMELVGLDPELADRYPSQLSGGQQQRVGVARALMVKSNILLMDEPFGAVDPIVRAELQELLKNIQKEFRKTVIFVTHDIEEALTLADQIVVLAKGAEILQKGTPGEIISKPANDFISSFVGADKANRQLKLSEEFGQKLIRDADGKVLGTLDQ